MLTALRVAGVAAIAAAAFLGTYAIGEAGEDSGTTQSAAPAGKDAPAAKAVPVPAAARLPSLREAPAALAPRRAAPRVRRAAPAPSSPAPAPAQPAPEAETGTPFFDAE